MIQDQTEKKKRGFERKRNRDEVYKKKKEKPTRTYQ